MERFTKALKELCDVCSEEGWGDPLNYGRSREIDMAIKLGHTISNTLAGPTRIIVMEIQLNTRQPRVIP
jgi:hypothetical protein